MIGTPKEYGRYMHQYTYSTHICSYVCMFLLCLPPPQPPYKGIHKGGRPPPFVEAAEGRLLYMAAGEVASIAKTYGRISKYALNMYVDAYISHIS